VPVLMWISVIVCYVIPVNSFSALTVGWVSASASVKN